MRWFKTNFLHLRFTILANYARRQFSKQHPNRKLCEDLLKELSAEQFQQYHPSAGLGRALQTRYANIDSYTRRMKDTVRLIRENKMIPVDWIAENETATSVDRFLTSSDGYYLDVVQAVQQFKDTGLQLCQVMAVSDYETVGLPEHNLRMLTKLFTNLRDITTSLIEVSLRP